MLGRWSQARSASTLNVLHKLFDGFSRQASAVPTCERSFGSVQIDQEFHSPALMIFPLAQRCPRRIFGRLETATRDRLSNEDFLFGSRCDADFHRSECIEPSECCQNPPIGEASKCFWLAVALHLALGTKQEPGQQRSERTKPRRRDLRPAYNPQSYKTRHGGGFTRLGALRGCFIPG